MSPAAKSEFTRAQMLALMAHADGELDPNEYATFESEFANRPDSVEVVSAFRGLGERVRVGLGTPPDLTESIMARIAAEVPAAPHYGAGHAAQHVRGAHVVDLAAVRARRVKVGAAVMSFVAVAAAVTLWFGRSASHLVPDLVPQFATAAMGVQVQQVDSQAMVYSIPAVHSNASSVVVWLGDETDDSAAVQDAAPQPNTKAAASE